MIEKINCAIDGCGGWINERFECSECERDYTHLEAVLLADAAALDPLLKDAEICARFAKFRALDEETKLAAARIIAATEKGNP